MRRVYLYCLYERLWHWLQAFCILGLLLTGLELHWPDVFALTGFATAITIHNVLGFLLLGNAFLALFYYWSTGAIRQFLPEPHDFFTLAVRQLLWYVHGMFRGEPHPFERHPQHKLNPLQKITYLAILNVLLPLQVATGLLTWAGQRWPDALARIVTWQRVLSSVHSLGAWLFAAFLIAHVYLTTTGPTPLALLRAMIVGWDEREDNHVLAEKQGN
jgi:thiosulfate reductase cytochrome b subunit